MRGFAVCGTGKTFTALKIAERIADEKGGTARFCFWCRRFRY